MCGRPTPLSPTTQTSGSLPPDCTTCPAPLRATRHVPGLGIAGVSASGKRGSAYSCLAARGSALSCCLCGGETARACCAHNCIVVRTCMRRVFGCGSVFMRRPPCLSLSASRSAAAGRPVGAWHSCLACRPGCRGPEPLGGSVHRLPRQQEWRACTHPAADSLRSAGAPGAGRSLRPQRGCIRMAGMLAGTQATGARRAQACLAPCGSATSGGPSSQGGEGLST